MSRININFELSDGMIDDAAAQVIKAKVRSLTQAEIDGKLAALIDETVKRHVEHQAKVIQSKYDMYGDARFEIRKQIVERAKALEISDEIIEHEIKKIANRAYDVAGKYAADLQNKAIEIDEQIRGLVANRVDALFSSELAKALRAQAEKSAVGDIP